jgi:two-component system, NtrC family, response regulator AtoC
MAGVRQRAAKLCSTNVPVLLYGDGGTGKELLARWIYWHSPSSAGQFVKVNCAAIPGALLESELFGYEKGAFTGAQVSKPGRVELAHDGALLLDEITDLDIGLQSKLLQFLQDGRFTRIGNPEEIVVETRFFCATRKNLLHEMDAGRFRADLYYRINVVCLRLPPLRERREDIPLLAEYFRVQYQEKLGKSAAPLSPELLRNLQDLDWPGNVRELSNYIARYVVLGADADLFPGPQILMPSGASVNVLAAKIIPLKQFAKGAVRQKEKELILEVLQANHWNRRKTAQALNISYRTLIYKIRKTGLVTGKTGRLSSSKGIPSIPLSSPSD